MKNNDKNIMKTLLLCAIMCLFTLTAFGSNFDFDRTATNANTDPAGKLPKLLDLGAHKCIPCKKMAPILDELREEYKGVFDVEFIDVWQPENKEKAKEHGINLIPTQIFFDAEGKELWRHEGFFSKEEILNKWKELGYTFAKPDLSDTE